MKEIHEVTYQAFVERIAKDFDVSAEKETVLSLPADKKVRKKFTGGRSYKIRTFDGKNELPYLLDNGERNEIAFSQAVELRCSELKSFEEIISETGAEVSSKRCHVDAGGGCYTRGYRFTYKDIFIEL